MPSLRGASPPSHRQPPLSGPHALLSLLAHRARCAPCSPTSPHAPSRDSPPAPHQVFLSASQDVRPGLRPLALLRLVGLSRHLRVRHAYYLSPEQVAHPRPHPYPQRPRGGRPSPAPATWPRPFRVTSLTALQHGGQVDGSPYGMPADMWALGC